MGLTGDRRQTLGGTTLDTAHEVNWHKNTKQISAYVWNKWSRINRNGLASGKNETLGSPHRRRVHVNSEKKPKNKMN
jgi:hypothetical protein